MASKGGVPPISGRFSIDVAQPMDGAGGGLPAFAATDRLEPARGLMAMQLSRTAPPRAEAIAALAEMEMSGVLLPRAVGAHADAAGKPGGWLICEAPPGPDLLRAAYRWPEAEIIAAVLRPAAAALLTLSDKRLTHRGIRVDNLFRAGAGQPIRLGCAWATPPAALQPVLYEPLGSAICPPAARGEGLIADDVYALGVVLLALCLGRPPLAGLTDAAILDRKLDLGSHAAMTDGERIPQAIFDLTRGMLAEDPEHRPSPALLLDPTQARTRRVAARAPRKSQRAFEIGGETVLHARTMSRALGRNPEDGARELRSGAVDRWLRHGLGDTTLASRLDDIVQERSAGAPPDDPIADAILVMRAAVMLDPLAPLWWRGVALWPDALGGMLADGGFDNVVEDLISNEIIGAWGAIPPERSDTMLLQGEGRRLRGLLRQRGLAGGLNRLRYALNPLLSCASRLLDEVWVTEPADLLLQLERVSGRSPTLLNGIVDDDIAVFLIARLPHGVEGEIARLNVSEPIERALAQLNLLARLQELTRAVAAGACLPQLAAWFADQCRPLLVTWPNRKRVDEVEAALPVLITQGRLRPLLTAFDDPARDGQDEAMRVIVRDRVDRIDRALIDLRTGRDARRTMARDLGGQIAIGLGIASVTVMLGRWLF
jgi:hypothetical protein